MKTELSRRHLLRLASLVGAGTVLPASGTAAQRRAATSATTAAPPTDASVYTTADHYREDAPAGPADT